MLMVIFGAGASYDSDPARLLGDGHLHVDRPPLADELFANRPQFAEDLSVFRACWPIVPFLRGKTHIEQTLEQLQQEASGSPPDPERLRQLAATRCYLQLMLSRCGQRWYDSARHITNYLTLLDEIRHGGNTGVLLVTFNYDNMLERAVSEQSGVNAFERIEDYISSDKFTIVKLHGSVNWGRVINDPPSSGNGWEMVHMFIDQFESLNITSEYVVTNDLPLCRDKDGRPLFPAIAIPVETKRDFECPEAHLKHLCECLPRVRRILIVGWRGMDQHFVALLRKHLSDEVHCDVLCEDGGASQKVIAILQDGGLRGRFQALGHGFSRYVTERVGKDFFRTS